MIINIGENIKIKMIVTDLDGTLLRDDKTVSERTISVLKRCREKGIKIAFATARGRASRLSRLPFSVDFFNGFVRMNGAAAFAEGERVYHKPIPLKTAREFLALADNAGIPIAAEITGKHFANFDISEIWDYMTCEIVDVKLIDFEPEKMYSPLKAPQIAEFLRKNLPDNLYMTVSRDELAMIMHKEAVKSKAVFALAEHWGIKSSEIAAFGDDLNDLDLLEHCGMSVAVKNALDEVKDIADFICDSNQNDGVAKWIAEKMRL